MNKLEKLKELKKSVNINIDGINNYPLDSTVIIFSNHTCLMDIFYIPMILPKEIVSAISARLIYKKDISRQEIINDILNPIPIEAHGTKFYKEACINNASNVLESGISISIFPEGVYIKDKNMIYRGRTGGTRILFNALINNSNIKLVPISINYNEKINDIDSYYPDNNQVNIKILEPINYEKWFEMYMNTNDYDIRNNCLHAVTDLAMQSIAKSLNQDYSNNYFKLDPKDMIFPDGRLISNTECLNEELQEEYKNTLEESTKVLCRSINRK